MFVIRCGFAKTDQEFVLEFSKHVSYTVFSRLDNTVQNTRKLEQLWKPRLEKI